MSAPRLHVLTALASSRAVVLRRGPADRVACLLWDRESGALTLGQWLHGTIYNHRCDLSPDGRLMVYMAMRSGRPFTAVSTAPHFRAHVFLPQDSTWGGGGAFTADGRLWGIGEEEARHLGLRAAAPEAFPPSTDGFFRGGTWPAKLALRGWTWEDGAGTDARLWKPWAGGRLWQSFTVGAKDRTIISERYALEAPNGSITEHPDWTWADTFGDRLQFAVGGQLWQTTGGVEAAEPIHDLRAMEFEARDAPYATGDAP